MLKFLCLPLFEIVVAVVRIDQVPHHEGLLLFLILLVLRLEARAVRVLARHIALRIASLHVHLLCFLLSRRPFVSTMLPGASTLSAPIRVSAATVTCTQSNKSQILLKGTLQTYSQHCFYVVLQVEVG